MKRESSPLSLASRHAQIVMTDMNLA
jgi:hypothetical protein